MLSLGTIVIGADDTQRAVAFWTTALGYEPTAFEGASNGFTLLTPPSGEGTKVAIQQADTPPTEHPRIHIDLLVADADEQQAETTRLLELGATAVEWDSYPSDADFVVLADTEGNRFCIINAAHGQ